MKKLEEFSKEVMASKELQKELLAVKPENVEEFLKKHNCQATLSEVEAFIGKGKSLSDEEISQVAAGKGGAKNITECHCENPSCRYYEHGYYVEGNAVGETFQCPDCNNTMVGTKYLLNA